MSRQPKQRALAHVAEALEANEDELFSPDPLEAGERERIGLVAIVRAMQMEAARVGTSVRHLSGGCHISYTIQDDKRDLVAWRDLSTVPSETELRTLHRDFELPYWVMWVWVRRNGLKQAVASWSTGEPRPTGEVFDDMRIIAQVRELIERGEFVQARATYGRIHGRMEQLAMLDEIIAAKEAAQEARRGSK